MSGLLENVGTHINPLTLIDKIPRGMEIIGLRDRLVKIIYDYNLQTTLKEGCTEVLKADCKILADKLILGLRRGMKYEIESQNPNYGIFAELIFSWGFCFFFFFFFFCRVDPHARCPTCNNLVGDAKQRSPIVVFFCGHSYHQKCLNNSVAAQQQPAPSPNAAAARKVGGPQTSSSSTSSKSELALDKGLFCSICRQNSSQDKRANKRV